MSWVDTLKNLKVECKVKLSGTQKLAKADEELRADALHVFISGQKKPLRSIVFPTQPKNLQSALALDRETEANIERSIFSNSYAKAIAERRV